MIQISRLGDNDLRSNHSSHVLQPGQPFWDGNNNQLYVGDGTSALGILKPVGKPQAGIGIEVIDGDNNDAPAKLNLKVASSTELGGVKLGYATTNATQRPLLIDGNVDRVYTSLPKIEFSFGTGLTAVSKYDSDNDKIQTTYSIRLARGISYKDADSTDFSGLADYASLTEGQSKTGLKLIPATEDHLGGVKMRKEADDLTTRKLYVSVNGEAYVTLPSLTFSSGAGISGEITKSTNSIAVQYSLKAGSEKTLGGIKYVVTNTTPTTFQTGTFYFVTT